MTSYAPLLAHIPAKGWAQNLIELNPAHVNPTVNYEVERLFSTHLGDTTYAVSIEQTASRPPNICMSVPPGMTGMTPAVTSKSSIPPIPRWM